MEEIDPLIELQDIRVRLRRESENRVVEDVGSPMYTCLASSIESHLSGIRNQRNTDVRTSSSSSRIGHYRRPRNIQRCVADLLEKHSKQFQSVLELLVDVPADALPNNASANRDHEKQLESFYIKVISDCKTGTRYQAYIKLCIYAAATCINTPIYILTYDNGNSQWSYFQPLFEYEGQPGNVIRYITMFMAFDKTFHNIVSNDIPATKPSATGLVGMYLAVLKETQESSITVPGELRNLSPWAKSKLCYNVSSEIVFTCCTLMREKRLIQMDAYDRMTAHRATIDEFAMTVTFSDDAFIILCQVLLKRRAKTLLTPYLNNWDLIVDSCDFLKQFNALVALDHAICRRNISVASFVSSCKDGGQELDERRRRTTTTVIASSSVGIVSGGMVIAGLMLAPFSFGTSLGLSIAGGAVGVGTGVAAGTARTVEAVKQNTILNDIRQKQTVIQEEERRVADALDKTEQCFRRSITRATAGNDEGPGISIRGFLAIGSAFRAGHSIAGIALAAVRLSATAATVAASVLGPLSLVFDAAFLAEAAHNKAAGDKTNAGELLATLAETVDIKCKVFNDMLRGNCNGQTPQCEWS